MNTDADADLDDDDESEDTTDAIELLTTDHDEVRQLFAEYEQLAADEASDEEREELAGQICDALTAHATVEEEIFYPAARDVIDDVDLIDEAVEEHAGARSLIEQIRGMRASDEQYDATVRELQEAIEHHVHEEEQELFPLLRESSLDLQALADEMTMRKEEVLDDLLGGDTA